MKRKSSILWKILGGLLLAPLLLAAFVQTPVGKRLLASELSKRLSRSGSLTVEIGRIDGWIPASVRIDRLEIGDADGVWLRAGKLRGRWAMRDLLNRRIRMPQLGAESIELRRLPKVGTSSKEPPRRFRPPEAVVENLDIEQLRIGGAVAGVPMACSVRSNGLRLLPSGEFSGILKMAGDLSGHVALDLRPGGQSTLTAKLEAGLRNVGGAPATLRTTARLISENGRWSVDFQPLEFRFLDGLNATVTGQAGSDRLALAGSLEQFDLTKLPIPGISNLVGRVGGTLALTGSLAGPALRAELDVERVAPVRDALENLPEINLHVTAQLAEGRFSASTVVTNSEVGGLVEGGLEMPFAFALSPFAFRPEPDRLHARLAADLDFGILNRLALFDNQRVAGRLKAELAYDRRLHGFVRVEQGAYEHFGWGVVLRDLNMELEASDEGLRVKKAAATDGGDGRVTLDGGISARQIALELQMDKAAVLRRDDVDGTLSGHLEIGGSPKHPDVAGTLAVDRAEVLLDNIAPALPPLLTDYDASAPGNAATVAVKKKRTLPFALDLRLDLADRVFVNASMIDSVWGGSLRVRNVPQGISVQGTIEPRRGYVSFVGKKFRFTDGEIELDGKVPALPVMKRVTAEYSRGDFTARLILDGRIDNPSFRLESTPAMPEDEVLSQVLFGRDTSSITPYQAVQIASAARQLAGGMNGPGFMYRMRQAMGVDTLEWREGAAEGDASSLAAGKYITPSLYVEVSRSLDEKGEMGMTAEYEMTDHFSVETSTGPKMRPGIGVTWRNDY